VAAIVSPATRHPGSRQNRPGQPTNPPYARNQSLPSREPHPFEIEVDGTRRGFERQDIGVDWIVVHNLGDEYLYVHAQHAGSEVISVATIAAITPYVDGNRRIGPLS
jgi:hypothetical protein